MDIKKNNFVINNHEESTSNLDKHERKTHYLTAKKHSLNNTPLGSKSITKAEDITISRETVGGKGSALYRMQQAGMKVPEFTTIDVKSIENLEQYSLDIASLKPFINDIASFNLAEVNIANIKQYIQNRYSNQPEQRNLYLQGLAKFITNDSFYQQISNSQTAESIRENYNQLIASLAEDSAIIVRSSGIKEDNYGDAQAGKFESLVHGKQDIVLTCLQVLASGFEPHVCPFSAPQPMSLIIQRCIDCSFGGVAMSRTSLKDHRGKIEFVPGQPKGGVSGVAGVTPHTYLVTEENDKFTSDFTEGNVTSQFILKQQDNNNFEEKPVALTENSSVNLTEEQLKQIYQYIKQGEDMLLCPVDFEFAIAKDGTVYALQLRPLTVLTGGVNFAIDPPKNPITTGTLISEGFCAGELFYVQSEQDADLVPQGAIVVANHGETWMVDNNQFFKKVGGFIFQQGGANDHIAITMRQQEKPYLVTTDNFDELKHSNAIVSLACGNFKENPGAYVTAGREFADKLATMQSTVKATYKPRSSEAPVRQTPVLYFNRPDIAFKNLHDLNYILLDYFDADSWLTRCFTEKSMLLLSMAPHRIEILKEATEEIGQLFATFDLFLSGYQQYLQLGIQPATDSEELQQKLAETKQLTARFNTIKTQVNNYFDNILQQFTSIANQTIAKGDFSQLLQNATKIFTDTQKLNIPKTINEINSLHDIILWIHREFIEILAPVAINSGLGVITRHTKFTSILFSNTEEQQLIKNICVALLNNIHVYGTPTIVIMENIVIVTIQLGIHICTIEMLEHAEAGKERTLKLKLSDDFTKYGYWQGKLKRFWLFAQILNNIGFTKNASDIKTSVEESTGILSIEVSHIESKQIILKKLSMLIPILGSLSGIDMLIDNSIHEYNINWNFLTLKQKLANLSLIEDQQYFNYLVVVLGCIFDLDKFSYIDDRATYTNTSKFYQLYQIIKILRSTDNLSIIEMQIILDQINLKHQKKLLVDLLATNVLSIVNFVKIKYPCWFTEKQSVIKLVSLNGILLKHASSILRDDQDVALAATKNKLEAFAHVGTKITSDEKFMLNYITNISGYALFYACPKIQSNKSNILAAVKNSSSIFLKLNDSAKQDKNIALAAIEEYAYMFKFASIQLQQDKNFILTAIKTNKKVYNFINNKFAIDREILQAYKTDENKL